MNLAGRVATYDTTLRDGAQQQSVSFTVEDKLAVARILDRLGVAYIEAGWPGAIPKDTELFARAAAELELSTARLVAFGSTCRPGTDAEEDPQLRGLLDSGAPVVTIVAKSDPAHVDRALRTTREENLRMVADSVRLLVEAGREVMVDLEHYVDGVARDPGYGVEVALVAARAGAGAVIPCDTNGGSLPGTVATEVARLRAALDAAGQAGCVVGIHTHDDSGLAVATAMAAVDAGARQVQGCVNGFGERTGNANLLTLIANLELKTGYQALPGDSAERGRRLEDLSTVSRKVGEIANRAPSGRLPYVGSKAFAHKAGLHASAIKVDPNLYQHVDPARVGNTMTMLVSEMAGRASIELKARELGIETGGDSAMLAKVTEVVKDREAAGYAYDAADGSFELLLRQALGQLPEYFRVESWRASISARPAAGEEVLPADGATVTDSEATVRMWIGGQRLAVLGEGNGPVNALDHALCDALATVYPEIRAFELTDFKVRILDSERGTHAIVRVLIDLTDGERSWSTVGVGTDIIEASWEALTDGHVVGLLRAGIEPR
ncbi:citramalate synthase [Actinomyces faecalis]|uniref:citramalate synthase n=1 Tax=Actinomyces faecalis TaxID=2722820 RepID=UPI00155653AC|nr:citramalate synthase [Actinomyces faecalis]